jgi:hypothetical protein
VKGIGWTLRMAAMIGGASIFMGCAGSFKATDGTTFACHRVTTSQQGPFCHDSPDPMSSALSASGAHDLPCAIDKVDVTHLSGSDYAASGCGWRVVYRIGDDLRIELLSRSPLAPGGDQPVPASAPVPSTPARIPPPAPTAQ